MQPTFASCLSFKSLHFLRQVAFVTFIFKEIEGEIHIMN